MKITTEIEKVDGEYRILPLRLGVSTILFRTKLEALQVANALDYAYHRGRTDLQSELRSLLGAAKEEDCP